MTAEPMRQEAPFPEALKYLVDRLSYRPGWKTSTAGRAARA